jgi:hypothetical protein
LRRRRAFTFSISGNSTASLLYNCVETPLRAGRAPRRNGPQRLNVAGAEKLEVRAKIRPRVGASTLVKPKQTDAAIITPEAPRTRIGVGVTTSQATEGENIDMKKIHHLMHAGRPPLFSPPNDRTHNTLPFFYNPNLKLVKAQDGFYKRRRLPKHGKY